MSAPSARPGKVRRPGYAPAANVGVGRRGLHTRERILACAADVFLINGFHSTSLDTIAKAAGASRATVYQYFSGKDAIFQELCAAAERDVLAHGERLGELGPTVDGVTQLHRWLVDWADVYDAHAAVFAEYPGIGTALSVIDVGEVAETFADSVTARIRAAGVRGLHVADAAAALMRIPHMVHLYRYRAMLVLPGRSVVTWSLTVAMQLMLFPETPVEVLRAAAPADGAAPHSRAPVVAEPADAPPEHAAPLSVIALDVLTVSSELFAERGYYAVGMERIADAAELSRATLYRYFSSKERILAELTRRAVIEIEQHSTALSQLCGGSLTEWMLGYVRFHRAYRGVIRAWFDGTVAEQLSDAAVHHGIGAIQQAIGTLLNTVDLPAGMDQHVAAAVFLAVLGRMNEPTTASAADVDEHIATMMVELLQRARLSTA